LKILAKLFKIYIQLPKVIFCIKELLVYTASPGVEDIQLVAYSFAGRQKM
jgi:hypothetical protein